MKKLSTNLLFLLFAIFNIQGSLAQELKFSYVDVRDKQQLLKAIELENKLPNSDSKNANLGIMYHQLALSKVANASKQAEFYLQKYLAKYPKNAMIVALYGSSQLMLARDVDGIGNKLDYANKSIDTLELAYSLSPTNNLVRVIRIYGYANLPAMFGKRNIARKEIKDILAHKTYKSDKQRQDLEELLKKIGSRF